MHIGQDELTFIIGIFTLIGLFLSVYNAIRKPQIDQDKEVLKLREDFNSLSRTVDEIKNTHLKNVESDVKILTSAVNETGKSLVKLATIIDERIPKASPNLTPPGK